MPAIARNLGLGVILSMQNRLSGPALAGSASMNVLEKSIDKATVAQLRFSAVTKAGGALLVGAGGAAIALGILTASAASFETGMSRVSAVLEPTRQELQGLTDVAIKAGIATQFSPKQATEGLKDLSTAGFNAKESMSALNPVLDLATGSLGQLGVAEAATAAAAAVRGFGFEAKDTAKVVDILLRSTQLTNIQARDLQTMLARVAGNARIAGQEFEQTIAVLGALRNTGAEASVAATTLRSALRAMTQPKAAQAMDRLGVSLFDANGNFRDLSTVIFDLNRTLGDLTEKERQASLMAIFGARGMNTFNAVAALGETRFAALESKLKSASGTAAKFRKKVLEPLSGRLVLMLGSIQTLASQLGAPLLSPVKILVSVFTKVLNIFIRLTQAFPIVTSIVLRSIALGVAITGLVGAVLLLSGVLLTLNLRLGLVTKAKAAYFFITKLIVGMEEFSRKQILLSLFVEKLRLTQQDLINAKIKARIILERILGIGISKRTSITFAAVSAATAERIAALGTNAALVIQNVLRKAANLLTIQGIKATFLSAKASVASSTAMTAASASTGLFVGALRGLKVAIATNPILLAIAAIALVAVAAFKLSKAFLEAKGAAVLLFGFLLSTIFPVIFPLIAIVKVIKTVWEQNIGGIKTSLIGMKDALVGLFSPLNALFKSGDKVGALSVIFKGIMTLVLKPFALIFDAISKAVTIAGAVIEIVVSEINAAFAPIQPAVEELSAAFDSLTVAVFGRGKSNLTFWKKFGQVVRTITKVVLIPLVKVISVIVKGISLMTKLIKLAISPFVKVGEAIKAGIGATGAFRAGLNIASPGLGLGLGLLGLQHGGVTTKPTTARLSERGQTEVAMPLPTGMRPSDLRDILQSFKKGIMPSGAGGGAGFAGKIVIENRIFLDSREIHRSQREIDEIDQLRSFGLSFGEA